MIHTWNKCGHLFSVRRSSGKELSQVRNVRPCRAPPEKVNTSTFHTHTPHVNTSTQEILFFLIYMLTRRSDEPGEQAEQAGRQAGRSTCTSTHWAINNEITGVRLVVWCAQGRLFWRTYLCVYVQVVYMWVQCTLNHRTGISLYRVKNRPGHWVRWMSTGRKNRLMRRTHTQRKRGS